MAYIELESGIVGSSVDNFIAFKNDNSERPFVTFYFRSGNPVGRIIVKDALDDDGYNKIITYSPNEIITDSSFRTNPNNHEASTFALLECLRKNNIFFDITIMQDIPNVGLIIKAYIDSSTRYTITVGENISLGGTYSSYVPKEPNKFVILENTLIIRLHWRNIPMVTLFHLMLQRHLSILRSKTLLKSSY